ncbi:MAG: M1 family peptidase, partial [Myxococcota bacterium]
MRRPLTLCVVLVTLGCTPSSKTAPQKSAEETESKPAPTELTPPLGQLGDEVTPIAYRLELTLVPELERFEGVVEIDVDFKEATRRFFIHSKRITVTKAQVGETAASFSELTETGLGQMVLESEQPAGPATLRVEYSAPFNRALEGIYRVDEGGESYAFSQFEAIGARLAFPGFDEPRFKVPFELSVTAKSEHVVITTTPETGSEPVEGGMTKHVFAKTKPLPTYLLAFAVGPLDLVEWTPIPPSAL